MDRVVQDLRCPRCGTTPLVCTRQRGGIVQASCHGCGHDFETLVRKAVAAVAA